MIELLLYIGLSCSQAESIIKNVDKLHLDQFYCCKCAGSNRSCKGIHPGVLMRDQNSIPDYESKQDKWNRGLDIFIESVIKPDPALRQCAHNQGVIMKHGYTQ